jgi:hypothetical protein
MGAEGLKFEKGSLVLKGKITNKTRNCLFFYFIQNITMFHFKIHVKTIYTGYKQIPSHPTRKKY